MRIIPRRMVSYSAEEFRFLLRSIFSNQRSNAVENFEHSFSNYVGSSHAVAVSSIREGFSRLFDLLDLKVGDEVILSAYNYHVIALIVQKKGLIPVFVDIDPGNMNIDSSLIEARITQRTKCVIATHLFGVAADMERIVSICKQHKLILIEDAAHSCGAEWGNKKIGSFGDYGLFSFGTGKPLVTLGGGMIVGRHGAVLKQLRDEINLGSRKGDSLKSKMYFLKCLIQIVLTKRMLFTVCIYPLLTLLGMMGFDPIERLTGDKYTPADVSSKSKLGAFTSLQAGLGLMQLRKLDQFNDGRIAHAIVLDKMLKEVKELQRTRIESSRQSIVLSYNVVVNSVSKFRRFLLVRGVDTKESSMRNCAQVLCNASSEEYPELKVIDDRLVELPCSHLLGIKDIYHIGNVVRKYFGYKPVYPEPRIVTDE